MMCEHHINGGIVFHTLMWEQKLIRHTFVGANAAPSATTVLLRVTMPCCAADWAVRREFINFDWQLFVQVTFLTKIMLLEKLWCYTLECLGAKPHEITQDCNDRVVVVVNDKRAELLSYWTEGKTGNHRRFFSFDEEQYKFREDYVYFQEDRIP